MKLAPAIEEFIRYKQALGNSYITPARALNAFLRQTGNVDFDELSVAPRRRIPVRPWWHSHKRLVSPVFGAWMFLSVRDQPRVHEAPNTPELNPR